MTVIGNRPFDAAQLDEQLAEVRLRQNLESGNRLAQGRQIALEDRQLAAAIADRAQVTLIELFGAWRAADESLPPIAAVTWGLHRDPFLDVLDSGRASESNRIPSL